MARQRASVSCCQQAAPWPYQARLARVRSTSRRRGPSGEPGRRPSPRSRPAAPPGAPAVTSRTTGPRPAVKSPVLRAQVLEPWKHRSEGDELAERHQDELVVAGGEPTSGERRKALFEPLDIAGSERLRVAQARFETAPKMSGVVAPGSGSSESSSGASWGMPIRRRSPARPAGPAAATGSARGPGSGRRSGGTSRHGASRRKREIP